MTADLRCAIGDASQTAEARRRAVGLAAEHRFGEVAAGAVALVVTEMATNLLKHAGGGEILLRANGAGDPVFEALALDKGPGMRDVAACHADGYSTGGSPGTGLGAVARLSAACDVYSQPGKGTALLARLTRTGSPSPARDAQVGGVAVAKPGETACGDRWAAIPRRAGMRIGAVDGLGHGAPAAEAAECAIQAFERHAAHPPREVVEAMHVALRGTRGAAVAVADLDGERQLLTFAGVGNIAGTVIRRDGARSTVSYNGIVGHIMPRFQELVYPCPPDALVVLHSDGVTTHWTLAAYPGLDRRDASLIAAVLYRDFGRGRDDATVVVARSPTA